MVATFFIHVDISPSPNFSDFMSSLKQPALSWKLFLLSLCLTSISLPVRLLFISLLHFYLWWPVSSLVVTFCKHHVGYSVKYKGTAQPHTLLCWITCSDQLQADCEEGDVTVHSSWPTSAVLASFVDWGPSGKSALPVIAPSCCAVAEMGGMLVAGICVCWKNAKQGFPIISHLRRPFLLSQ